MSELKVISQYIITFSEYKEVIFVPKIKCKVTECNYNADVMCDAPMVEVDHNGVSQSNTSDQTLCQTFKPKG